MNTPYLNDIERLFGRESRITIWRKLWYWLAQSQRHLGLMYVHPWSSELQHIDGRSLEQLRQCMVVIKSQTNDLFLKELTSDHKLDLRAQYHLVAQRDAPLSSPWLNLGVLPEYILENTEQILMRDALDIMNPKLAMVLNRLRDFATKNKSVNCVMFESDLDKRAWVTTIGERVAAWSGMLLPILTAFESTRLEIGSAGSQPITASEQHSLDYCDKLSMVQLFGGDRSKCEMLNELLRQEMGFNQCHARNYLEYRRRINALLGSACEILGKQVLQIVDDLNHFDANDQMVEKRPRRDKQPATARYPLLSQMLPLNVILKAADPKWRQSGHLKRTAIALIDASTSFQNPQVSKTEGIDDYIMARMFKHAARVVSVLDSIIQSLYCDSMSAHNLLYCELPFMISGPVIDMMVVKGVNRADVQQEFQRFAMLACARPEVMLPGSFYGRLSSPPFDRFRAEIQQIISSVRNTEKSSRRVDEICGERSELTKKLKPYVAYIEEIMSNAISNPGVRESEGG
ncbi:adenylosuccinate lyase [Fusarium beomiforme]|uniref:Adenylosuccinate lyase n=1 Tax=Fusarium beomiforme TaxID=44412 RepID=A0A9P5ADX1_9HYPO|nr:adenylosuccinate lyase [Fusarium beomiforme]